MLNTRVVLASRPIGIPTTDCFRVETAPVETLQKGLIRVKARYLSLDPYQRSVMAGNHMGQSAEIGDLIPGEAVCTVIESEHPYITVGSWVRCHAGWQSISDHSPETINLLPSGLSRPSLALSMIGMPGLTAYAAIHEIARVRAGDVVLIPAAIGGVGAMAGQLAKLAGATTIGITSSPDKCAIARSLGYTHVLSRHSETLAVEIAKVAPQGINVYLDLAGDPLLTIVAQQLAIGGKVILCGLIQDYNGESKTLGPPPGLWIGKRATVSGLVVYDYEHLRPQFEAAYVQLFEQGLLHPSEHFFNGLESAPEAFCRMMRGNTTGKVVIELPDF